MKDNYYDILGVNREATKMEIQQAYEKLSMCRLWEDNYEDKRMQQLKEAYSVLSDDQKRKEYDERLEMLSIVQDQKQNGQAEKDAKALNGVIVDIYRCKRPKKRWLLVFPLTLMIIAFIANMRGLENSMNRIAELTAELMEEEKLMSESSETREKPTQKEVDKEIQKEIDDLEKVKELVISELTRESIEAENVNCQLTTSTYTIKKEEAANFEAEELADKICYVVGCTIEDKNCEFYIPLDEENIYLRGKLWYEIKSTYSIKDALRKEEKIKDEQRNHTNELD